MRVDVLVAEIGSTTTVVSAFGDMAATPRLLGQGAAATSVAAGDVTIGLSAAIDDLRRRLGAATLTWGRLLAASSAAGGLRMTVHGLVYDMTVKAAREAALGAGAVLQHATAGVLDAGDLATIRQIAPGIILLAGGTDGGEAATVVANAKALATLGLQAPVIYAGNAAAAEQVLAVLGAAGIEAQAVANVYPRIDELNIEPTRQAIQAVFESHITLAPGMERVREMVDGAILPTPGAVMEAAMLLCDRHGDLMAVDVGGATTDVHSVTDGDPEVAAVLLVPEPRAKRTVEGDLGVYVNAHHVAARIGLAQLRDELGLDAAAMLRAWPPYPTAAAERRLLLRLTREAVRAAVDRHAGRLRHVYGVRGRRTVAEGKDLSRVRLIIGTGGPLSRLPEAVTILAELRTTQPGLRLLPPPKARVAIDRQYIMAAAGVLARHHPEAALAVLQQSLELPPRP